MSSYPASLAQLAYDAQKPSFPEPLTAIAGDTLQWSRSFSAYPAAAGWTLNYVLNSPASRIVVTAADIVPNGNGFDVLIPSAESKLWPPGTYQWLAVVQNAGQRFTVALGSITITFDILDATAPQDTRSQYEIGLANIDTFLSGRATDGVQEYMIQGRQLRRYSLQELLQLRSLFVTRVRAERSARGEIQPANRVVVCF